MYDHSYNPSSMIALLRKGDFRYVPLAERDQYRITTLQAATTSALTIFNGVNPIESFHLKKKTAYRVKNLADDIGLRKLALNLKKVIQKKPQSRTFLVTNLRHFLSEGVPYKVYRLDIKSFYESISASAIDEQINSLVGLSPLSKIHFKALMKFYVAIGGRGVPRGMAISAILSGLILLHFDNLLFNNPFVYYYGRYVDDIVIVTSSIEGQADFLKLIKEALGNVGLKLNQTKNEIRYVSQKTKVIKPPKPEVINPSQTQPQLKFSLEYLGYQFSIYDPVDKSFEAERGFRLVRVEIAKTKEKKIKQRIIKSFLDFSKTNNKNLLLQRITFLTSNFSIYDKNTGKRKLAGIYHSYPLLSENSTSLKDLDAFLRNSILSKTGRLFSKTSVMMDAKFKRQLLSQSFTKGHAKKSFIYFSSTKIHEIQACWKYE